MHRNHRNPPSSRRRLPRWRAALGVRGDDVALTLNSGELLAVAGMLERVRDAAPGERDVRDAVIARGKAHVQRIVDDVAARALAAVGRALLPTGRR